MTEAIGNSINSPTATLTAGILAGSAAIPVTAPVGPDAWPTGGNFRILIDGELIVCTAASPSAISLTVVTRGAEATIAASHALAAPVDLVLTRTSLLNIINQSITSSALNIADFGAVGDGITLNTTAIQNTINALNISGNDRGGDIWVPPGVYRTGPLAYAAAAPIRFLSEVSSQGNITGTTGASFVPSANNQTILTIGNGVGTFQEGAVLENINFYANGFTGCTGLKMTGVNNWRLTRVGFKDLMIGLEQRASATTDNAWNTLDQCTFVDCTTAAIKCYDAFGLVLLGGQLLVPDPGIGLTAYGIWCTGGAAEATQSIKSIGAFIDSTGHPAAGTCVGVFFERAHECLLDGMKFEQLDLAVDCTNLDGPGTDAGAENTLSNITVVAGAADTGVKVRANASDTTLINPSMTSVGTGLNNQGLRTKVVLGLLDVTTPWTGIKPSFYETTFPDTGSGRYTVTSMGSGSAADKLGFYGATPITKPTVSGSRGGNVALANLLTALANAGILTDSSS